MDSEGCFLFPEIGAFLSADYLWGLHFWRFDEPIGLRITCVRAFREETTLSLAECGARISI